MKKFLVYYNDSFCRSVSAPIYRKCEYDAEQAFRYVHKTCFGTDTALEIIKVEECHEEATH